MPSSVQLLVIDPQNDFCDLPPTCWPAGTQPSLAVADAHRHMQRLARWLKRQIARIDAITITLDSHQRFDIAHPGFWRAMDGSEMLPFTPITAAQVRAAQFLPREPAHLPRTLDYLDALERQGRYTLMVWPVHCELGGWGHGVHAELLAACGAWQLERQRAVHHVLKGMNPFTEHYSALMAEVVDPTDPATALNTSLLARLAQADVLVIAGEASSHCVRASVEHLVEYLPSGHAQRLVLLTDCMGPVAGFESAEQDFFSAMRAQGVQFATSDSLELAD
ncbi:MAG: cysteine hydrolase [Comamonas sp.]